MHLQGLSTTATLSGTLAELFLTCLQLFLDLAVTEISLIYQVPMPNCFYFCLLRQAATRVSYREQ